MDGPSNDSEYELFQEDLERLEPHIESAIPRTCFGESGVKRVYNGAIAYTPDGNPIIGPAWDLLNFWLNEGHSFASLLPVPAGSLPSGLLRVSRRLICLVLTHAMAATQLSLI